MDENEYFDTIPNPHGSKKTSNNKEYLSLSRNTVYYSAMDLGNGIELKPLTVDEQEANNIVVNEAGLSYSQWRDRMWKCMAGGERVDYVLAYTESKNPLHEQKRQIFEDNLRAVGLLLERDESQMVHFIKLHAPKAVLCQYAEILRLRLPIRVTHEKLKRNFLSSTINKFLEICSIKVDDKKFPPVRNLLTYEYSRDKDFLFDSDAPDFFKASARIMVVNYILEREKYDEDENCRGIKKLVAEGVYAASYPVHDGDRHKEGSKRKLLIEEWASIAKWIKYQPIDEIKEYFGIKFALYFTWLGFYTNMLIPAAVMGVLCLVYGAITVNQDKISEDICTLDITMCPRCDKYCDYWKLKESCTYSKIQHFMDNPATIVFAVFMSFWAALFLELWKRYSAEVTHRWGLSGFDVLAEPPRPEYLMRLSKSKKKKLNVVTLIEEPTVPFWRVKIPSIVLSFSIVLIWILVALSIVFGVTIYRMSLLTSQTLYSDRTSYRIYVVPVTAALINLVCIQVLNILYDRVAHVLTEIEIPRSQTEYEDSLTLKSYMFQFINYYSSIFYIAFLKGKFVGYPAKYNRVFGYRQEECNPGGCLMELTIQLAIIMIGNQALNSFLEMVIPLARKMYNTFKISTGIEKSAEKKDVIVCCNQWTEDFKLNAFQPNSLFQEYLEMVLQYGFVTLFVTAFPLAPLFALCNNIFEMRLDAKKFINYYRRPVPSRVKDIGVWMPIMGAIGRISVISNAFIIAFSSNFIPKLVYALKVSADHTSNGFLNHTLAVFDVNDFESGNAPQNTLFTNLTICRYAEYRNAPYEDPKYKRPLIYWHILAARLAFVVAYQNLVSFVIMAVKCTIPNIPKRLTDQIKREAYKTNEIIIEREAERARGTVTTPRDIGWSSLGSLANGDSSVPSSNRSTRYYDAESSE